MATHFRHLIVAAVLAFLCCLCGCAQMPSGMDLTFGLTGDPVGIQIRIKTLPSITQQTPPGWTSTQPALIPDSPASQPAVQ